MNNSAKKKQQKYIRIVYLLATFISVLIVILMYTQFTSKTTIVEKKKYIAWSANSLILDQSNDAIPDNVTYGYKLITNTSEYLGPLAQKESMRFAGNNLSCTNCHLDAGRKIGSGSFVGITNRFPQFRGRENKIGTLAERINGCFERSMNGRAMDTALEEMKAMIAYMDWLSKDVPKEIEKKYKGYRKINIPTIKADVDKGKILYKQKCMICHQENGTGMKKPGNRFTGYIYPPLGGKDSYNNGAGMHRVITAAEFIKSNMPLGATYDSPQVTDVEAYNVAAYINTFLRPEKKNKKEDFPDKKLKPVSTPYGPWVDNFSQEQHKFGPFQPIMLYYKKTYNITKSK